MASVFSNSIRYRLLLVNGTSSVENIIPGHITVLVSSRLYQTSGEDNKDEGHYTDRLHYLGDIKDDIARTYFLKLWKIGIDTSGFFI